MTDAPLAPARILDAAEDVLRRFGPAKATVVDVARALGVSHGSVYRHFPTKAALRDAVCERWLTRVTEPLEAIAAEDGPAPERLRRWLTALVAAKRARASGDPELFATYNALIADARDVITAHVDALSSQIARIIADGIARGEFAPTDVRRAGHAVLYATGRFHNPFHAGSWSEPGIDDEFDAVCDLVLNGLAARPRV